MLVPITRHDAAAIEQRLLDLAYTTDAKITVSALAYFAPCSLDDAAGVLDDLAARDRLSMEIVPGLVLHLFSMVSAAASARRLGDMEPSLLLTARAA